MTRDFSELVPQPHLAIQLMKLLFTEQFEAKRFASLIKEDPSLEVKLCYLANAPGHGNEGKVKNIDQALSILKPDTALNTAISLAFFEHFLNHSRGNVIDVKAFCTHSLVSAVIMRELTQILGVPEKESARFFLIGLLHDLGKLVLDAIPGSEYGKVLEQADKGISVIKAEREIFGLTHGEAMLRAVRAWHVPEGLIKMYKGWVNGRITIKTLKCGETASRISDIFGFYLSDPHIEKGPPLDFQLLPFIDNTHLLKIRNAVNNELKAFRRVLPLCTPDTREVCRALLRSAQGISFLNAKYERALKDLEFKAQELERLSRVFTGIIKSLEGEPLTFSVLESLMEEFDLDGAFMLNHEEGGEYIGYSAFSSQEHQAAIELVRLSEDELSESMKKTMEMKKPIRLEKPWKDEGVLEQCLGKVSLAWIAPAYVKGNLTSLIGVGIREEKRFQISPNFEDILDILAKEVGLSVENTRLYYQVRKEAETDALTGINNRGNIMQVLKSEFARFMRKSIPLSVAIFDIDQFKLVNDHLGHLAGDDFLIEIAQILKEGMRDSDYFARYGGDEFMVIYPYTSLESAIPPVERMREDLTRFCESYGEAHIGKKLSVSAGVAEAVDSMSDCDDLIRMADNALYQAKSSGRNQLVAYRRDPSRI